MKYVILVADHQKLGFKRIYPFIFAEYSTHSEVARSMIHMIGMETNIIPTVLSAGFCEPGQLGFQVTQHGSESLRLKQDSRQGDEDDRLLNLPNAAQGMLL